MLNPSFNQINTKAGKKDVEFDMILDKNEFKPIRNSFVGHSKSVNAIVVFGKPHYRIVTVSDDSKILVFGFEKILNEDTTGKKENESISPIKTLEYHNGPVHHVEKWDNEHFMTCGHESIYVSSLQYEVKRTFLLSTTIYQVLKLNSDLFLYSDHKNELVVMSYSKKKTVKKLDQQKHAYAATKLLLSKKFRNSFFMNTDNAQRQVKLINYEKNVVYAKFNNDAKKYVNVINSFINSQKEEILIVLSSVKEIYFYNVGKTLPIPDKKMMFKLNIKATSAAAICLGNRYFCYGNSYGDVKILEIEKHFSHNKEGIKYIHTDDVHSKNIYSFAHHKEPGKNSVLLFSGGNDLKVSCLKIFGMDLKDGKSEFEIKDLNDRIEFLRENREDFFLEEKYYIDVNLLSFVKFEGIFKWMFRM